MKKYYFSDGNEQKGPYSLEELKNNKVSATTLVWREGLSDWILAKELKELDVLFESTPPPLIKEKYNKTEKPKSNTKVKDELETQKKKTKVAKEIKFTGKIFLYSIILGVLSYPFFAYKGFKAIYLKNKYCNSYSDESIGGMGYDIKSQFRDLIPKGEEDYYIYVDWGKRDRNSESSRISASRSGINKYHFKKIVNHRIYEMKKRNIVQSFYFFIAAFLMLIFGRAIYFGSKKGVNWVAENSEK